jgi:hypothetical protein
MHSPMKAAGRTGRLVLSSGFSFVPARRRSREVQGALEPAAGGADVGDGRCSAGWLRRHAGEGIYKHRKPSIPVGRVASLPWRARGRAQMTEALGVPMMSAALTLGLRERRYTPDRSDSIGPPRDIGAATPD